MSLITRLALAVSLISLWVTFAHAQTLGNFDDRVARRAAQCEIGEFANALDAQAPQPIMLVASVSITLEEEVAKSGGGGGSWWFLGGRSDVSFETAQENLGEKKFNVHSDNKIACNDQNHITLGILDCLDSEMANFQGLGGYAECQRKTTGTLSVTANAKAQVWNIGFDVTDAWQKKRTYTVTVRVPYEGDAPGTIAQPPPKVAASGQR